MQLFCLKTFWMHKIVINCRKLARLIFFKSIVFVQKYFQLHFKVDQGHFYYFFRKKVSREETTYINFLFAKLYLPNTQPWTWKARPARTHTHTRTRTHTHTQAYSHMCLIPCRRRCRMTIVWTAILLNKQNDFFMSMKFFKKNRQYFTNFSALWYC